MWRTQVNIFCAFEKTTPVPDENSGKLILLRAQEHFMLHTPSFSCCVIEKSCARHLFFSCGNVLLAYATFFYLRK